MKPLRMLFVIAALSLSASPLAAQQAQVTCKDGTKSAGGRGACSKHGGINVAATKAETKVAKTEAKAEKKEAKTAEKAEKKAAAREEKKETKVAKTEAKEDEHEAAGATAECKDHTYSHAKTHKGACSRHGGVAKFLDGKK